MSDRPPHPKDRDERQYLDLYQIVDMRGAVRDLSQQLGTELFRGRTLDVGARWKCPRCCRMTDNTEADCYLCGPDSPRPDLLPRKTRPLTEWEVW